MKSDHEKVIDAIEERFYEQGKLSKRSDIERRTGLSEYQVNQLIDDLIGGQVVEMYSGGGGNPAIYATKQMSNAITSHIGEPDWIVDYEFEAKRNLREEVRDANEKIANYQVIELMLHAKGTPLEDGIEKGLKLLRFDPGPTDDEEDFFFEFDGEYFVAEAKGKSGQVSKSDINQLNGWVEGKLDEDYPGAALNGVIFHNAHCDAPPVDREDPLTGHAIEYLNLYGYSHISTYDFFELVKQAEEFEGTRDAKDELISSLREQFVERIRND